MMIPAFAYLRTWWWPFRTAADKRREADERAWAQRALETQRAIGQGYRLVWDGYTITPLGTACVPQAEEIEFTRKEWDWQPRVFRLADQAAEFNIAGLWWRPLPKPNCDQVGHA